MKHIIRFGTLEDKKDLTELAETYDMIVFNANAITHSKDTIANFIIRNICVKENKNYYIDPITYAFQDHLELIHSQPKKNRDEPGRKRVKDIQSMLAQPMKLTFDKLIDEYGMILEEIRENKPLQTQRLLVSENENVLKDFCGNVMNFQQNSIHRLVEESEIKKYLEYDNIRISKSLQPAFVIAPYFYMNIEQYKEWMEVNIRMYKICKISNMTDIEIRMEIFIDKKILKERDILTKIAHKYLEAECSGYILWISDFDETRAEKNEIENLLFFLKFFRDKSVYNAYGGFFSILLGNDEVGLLDGVSHGLEYGESRGGFPVGGGMPTPKYYFFPLHRRLKYLESLELLEKRDYIKPDAYLWGNSMAYLKEICRCKVCKELMPEYMRGFEKFRSTGMYEVDYLEHKQRRTKAKPEEKARCRHHYMYCKKAEFNYVKSRKLNVILHDLLTNKEKYQSLLPSGEKIGVIGVWVDAIQHIGE